MMPSDGCGSVLRNPLGFGDNIYGSPRLTKPGSQCLTKFTDMPAATFQTARLLLRLVTIMDVDAIFDSYAQDEEVARYLIWRPHRSRSETRADIERCIAMPSEVERTYMITSGRTSRSSIRAVMSAIAQTRHRRSAPPPR